MILGKQVHASAKVPITVATNHPIFIFLFNEFISRHTIINTSHNNRPMTGEY